MSLLFDALDFGKDLLEIELFDVGTDLLGELVEVPEKIFDHAEDIGKAYRFVKNDVHICSTVEDGKRVRNKKTKKHRFF